MSQWLEGKFKIYKTAILPVVLYGVNLGLTLWENID
jgi:hypothetical protein